MIQLQIDRIQQLHQQVRAAIEQDRLEELESLIPELSSRIGLLCDRAEQQKMPAEADLGLLKLSQTTDELIRLAANRLRIAGNELRQASEMRRAVTEYSVKPRKQQAHLSTGMDLVG